jgi:hypothetical protein
MEEWSQKPHITEKSDEESDSKEAEAGGEQTDGQGSGIEEPNHGYKKVDKQRLTAAVGRQEDNGATSFHDADGIEAVDGRVEEQAEGVIGQMVETEEKG